MCLLEQDQYANAFLHDANMAFPVQLYKAVGRFVVKFLERCYGLFGLKQTVFYL